MNPSDPLAPPAPPSQTAPVVHTTDDEQHGPDHVHVYETSGIAEGNKRVPKWLVVVFLSLLVFYFGYIVLHWNAQPGTAKFK
jgi:hypothetical protein